ncbi:TolC family protein [candidate division KSB1 bacterium]|nr:TolC family protein [candidate division KSB1 bacterium]
MRSPVFLESRAITALRHLCFLLLFFWLAYPVQAQVQPANPDSALQVILASVQGTPLSFQDALGLAVKQAPELRIANAGSKAAQAVVRRERNAFEPRLFFTLDHENNRLPTASFFAGAPILETRQTMTQTGIRVALPTGAQIEAAINTVSLRTNSNFAFLNPQYTTLGTVTVRQPLMSGFFISGRRDLDKAHTDLDAAEARRDQTSLTVQAEVEKKYWDLYAATRDFAVQQLLRDNAAALLQEAELRAAAGLVGPSQVANARVFLADQELAVLDRIEALDRVSDQLATLIGSRPASGQIRFLAVDEPPSTFPVAPVDTLLKKAMASNLDLFAGKKDIEGIEILRRATKWQSMPQVDVVGTIGGNGLAGVAQQVIFGGDTLATDRGGSISEALNQSLARDYSNWSVGVEVTIPISIFGGSGETARLHAERVRAEERYVATARALEEQVRATHRELLHGRQRLEVARIGVDAAQEQVRIGLIEFRNGRSTAFELVRLGADLAVAQQRYSQELVRTAKAAATLRQLTSGAYPVR